MSLYATDRYNTALLHGLVKKLIPESLGKGIEKLTEGILPLKNVFVRKTETVKKPEV